MIGQLTPEGELGSPLVFEIEDASLPTELRLAPDDHLSGNPAAKVVLIEYLDLQCPACRAIHPIVDQLENDFPDDLLVVRRHFPLTNIHVNALAAARVAEAADRQGMFREMVDLLFEKQDEWEFAGDPQPFFNSYADDLGLNVSQLQTDMNDPAISARIARDQNAAAALGIPGTPGFFVNGQFTTTPTSLVEFSAVVAAERNDYIDPFVVNRVTGEVLVATPAVLPDPGTSIDLDVRASNGSTEVINAVVSIGEG